jgi:pimeloyl-ACP methyl ester carboxylesterase
MSAVTETDLALASGRVHVRLHDGPGDLVVCVPGLSANAVGFDPLAEALAARGRRVAALDLRGRGRSETTGEGTYGWAAHARDVAEAIERLGAARTDVVGHSMGAFVAMQLAADAPERAGDLVLIDAAGVPEEGVLQPIGTSLQRLGQTYASADAYLDRIRGAGVFEEWGDLWERTYRYELEPAPEGGVRPATSVAAVLEDAAYGRDRRADDLWPRLSGRVLLVRAAVPLGDSGAFVLSAADAARFAAEVPGAELVEVPADHYGVLVHPRTVDAVAGFLAA